jgi:hypothetical protein
MSQVFAPAAEGLILLAVVYVAAYFGAGYVGYWAAGALRKWWRS